MDSKEKTRLRSRTAGVLIIAVLQEKLSSVQRIVLPNCIVLILSVWLCSSLNDLVSQFLCFLSLPSCDGPRQKPREKAALDCAHVGGQGQQVSTVLRD